MELTTKSFALILMTFFALMGFAGNPSYNNFHQPDFTVTPAINPNLVDINPTNSRSHSWTNQYNDLRGLTIDDGTYSEARVFGREYLTKWFTNMMAGISNVVELQGDSTTYSGTIIYPQFRPENILSNAIGRYYSKVKYYNDSVSGQNTEWWATNGTSWQTMTSRVPTLVIWHYGVNDGKQNPLTFSNNLNLALTIIRTNFSLTNCSLVLMIPSSSSIDLDNRGEAWDLTMNPIFDNAARRFGACLIDTYTYMRDSGTNAGPWMDNPYATNSHIHPLEQMNLQLWGKVADVLMPPAAAYIVRDRQPIYYELGTSNVQIGNILYASNNVITFLGIQASHAGADTPGNGPLIWFRPAGLANGGPLLQMSAAGFLDSYNYSGGWFWLGRWSLTNFLVNGGVWATNGVVLSSNGVPTAAAIGAGRVMYGNSNGVPAAFSTTDGVVLIMKLIQ